MDLTFVVCAVVCTMSCVGIMVLHYFNYQLLREISGRKKPDRKPKQEYI